MTPQTVPDAVFHTRVRNPALGGDNPFEWKDVTSDEIFSGKTVVVFALPGAFTPACSDSHLPGYERLYDDLRAAGVDEVYALSVNDAFVMFQWGKSRDIEKVKMLPDGNGEFTRKMGMLIDRTATGMGMRSWRYAMLVEDGTIAQLFAEPGFQDNPSGMPLDRSAAEVMLDWLRSR
ncbi:peroxiredoxin [Litorisediminicola beolgyonensis]|uniref:Glutathione-dependent peroxiredoxin n=1 Tax=Litorisediminicola beolgyonensis TaxID=1173614 RepID=A0ABW3ZJ32_9RHOB